MNLVGYKSKTRFYVVILQYDINKGNVMHFLVPNFIFIGYILCTVVDNYHDSTLSLIFHPFQRREYLECKIILFMSFLFTQSESLTFLLIGTGVP